MIRPIASLTRPSISDSSGSHLSSAVGGKASVRGAGVGGVVAPILFTILYLVLGLITSGYNAYSQTISELGQVGQPYAAFQDANFVLTGLLTIGFVVSLDASVARSLNSRIGSILLLAYPIAFIFVGTLIPLPSPLHVPVGSISFFATLVGVIITSWPMRKDALWHRIASFTLVTGVVSVVGFFFYGFLQSQSFAGAWLGLAQRLVLAPYFVWIEVLAIKLVSTPRPGS